MRESHTGEKAFHDKAIARLRTNDRRLQDRIDAMYVGKLDVQIAAFFDSKSAEWPAAPDRLLRDVQRHQSANQTYIEEGVQLLHPAHRARPVRKTGNHGKTATP